MSTSGLAWRLPERFTGAAPAVLLAGTAVAVTVARLPVAVAATLALVCVVAVWVVAKPVAGLLFVVLAVPFGSSFGVQVGGANVGAAECAVWLVLASWLASMVARREARLTTSWLGVSVLVFIGFLLASLRPGSELAPGIKEVAKWAEVFGLLLATAHLMSAGWLKAVTGIVLLTSGIAAAQGVYQFLFQRGPEAFLLGGGFMRAYGTFGQPNPYAGYLGLGATLAFGLTAGLLLSPGGRWRTQIKWMSVTLASGLLVLAAIVMSWSRGSWLGLATSSCAMMLAVLFRWRKRAAVVVGVVVIMTAVVLVLASPGAVSGAISSRLAGPKFLSLGVLGVEVTDSNFSIVERLAHWAAAIAMWRDHFWLGVGIGNYPVAYPQYALPAWDDALGHAHNYYLNVGAEAGLFGLLAFGQIWIAAIITAWRATARSQGMAAGVALGTLGAVIYLCVHNLFDNVFVHGIYLQAAIMLGLALYLARGGSSVD
ncbi:MAG TPA: O-antigen ligase family protein [Anaerolineae bacterium]|nr:O-antigen ligase family protein [Anaerolineae bacterium]